MPTAPARHCPFDWKRSWSLDRGFGRRRSPELHGGTLLCTAGTLFTYGYYADGRTDGQIVRALIASKIHGDTPSRLMRRRRLSAHIETAVEALGLDESSRVDPATPGFNLTLNWGRVAGQTVFDHAHLHVFPRYPDLTAGLGPLTIIKEYELELARRSVRDWT